jgi:hypothetical protein
VEPQHFDRAEAVISERPAPGSKNHIKFYQNHKPELFNEKNVKFQNNFYLYTYLFKGPFYK